MQRVVLEYRTPPRDDDRPRPVGTRTLVAGCLLGAVAGITGVCLAAFGTAAAGDAGRWITACGGAAVLILGLTAGCENRFFPRNVSDPRRAIQSVVVNLLLSGVLIAGSIWLPWGG